MGDSEVPGDARPLAGDGRRVAHRAGPLRVGNRDGAAVALVIILDDDAEGGGQFNINASTLLLLEPRRMT